MLAKLAILALLATPPRPSVGVGVGVYRGGGQPQPIFESTYAASGVQALRNSTTLTVGAGTLTLVACYEGTDAGASSWAPCDGITTGGSTLGKVEVGADFATGQGLPFLNGAATGVKFNGGDFFQSSNATMADITTEDFVVEFVVRPDTSGNPILVSKYDTGVTAGLYIYLSGGVVLRLNDANDANNVISTAITSAGMWTHALWFVDRAAPVNTTIATYGNGANYATTGSSVIDSLTSPEKFSIGAHAENNGWSPNGAVAALRIWTCAGCLSNTDLTDEAALALRRDAAALGLLADRSVGSGVPTVMTRASAATVPVYNSTTGITTMYLTGNNWMRLGSRIGTGESGYLSEISVTNKIQSATDVSATWTPLDVGDAIAAASADLYDNGVDEWRIITGDGTDGPHGVTQATQATTVAKWTYSAFVDASGATPAAFVYLYDSTVANCNAYFSLTTCAVGTAGAGATSTHSKDYGGTPKVCRVGITCTATAAAQTVGIQMADADGDNSTVSKTMGTSFIQMELAPLMTSWMASATVRSADVTDYTCTGNCALPGVAVVEAYYPNHTPVTTANRVLDISDGTANESLQFYFPVSGVSTCHMTDGAANPQYGANGMQGAVSMLDNAVHIMACSIRTGTSQFWLDGASIATDPAATMPTVTKITAGATGVGGNQANAFIRRISLYPATVTGVTR